MSDEILNSGGTFDDFVDKVAKKVVSELKDALKDQIAPPIKEDILFKSFQEAADYYGCCYQSISEQQDNFKHIKIGTLTKFYRSDFEAAMSREGFLKNRKRGAK